MGSPDGRHTLLLDLAKDPARRTPGHFAHLHATALRLAEEGQPVIIAGNLDPDNVQHAVRATRCRGVDVCGGVELSPGKKDPQRVAQFIAAVRELEEFHAL